MTSVLNKEIEQKANLVLDEIENVIIGKRDMVRLVLASVLCNGHILIEDVPGVGKTTLAKALARALGCSFKRIQFTPDLLPADITGTSIFNQKTSEFEFRPGPVFAQFVLADEINRATPKTQSSLLECMEERQVTVDGTTHPLPSPFFVIATENNIEYQGTYPLPEGQLDRFMVRLSVGYPDTAQESLILDKHVPGQPLSNMRQVLSAEEVLTLQSAVKDVFLETSLRDYIVAVVAATRNHPSIALGASPRGSINLSQLSRSLALISGREYVLPDDVKTLSGPVLAHRIILKPEARMRKIVPEDVVAEILSTVPVPVA
ncbi:MAG: MoxR family ATPase [Armatimonadetes bacterium]|nr:MoxR family ATPase [Armatimonadota bacterium]